MKAHIRVTFKEKARIARYIVFDELLSCKITAGDSIGPDVLKEKRWQQI